MFGYKANYEQKPGGKMSIPISIQPLLYNLQAYTSSELSKDSQVVCLYMYIYITYIS